MVARKMTRRKKAAPLPRKPRTGIAAAPTKSFHAFQDYFRLDLDRKDIAIVLKTYIRNNFEGEERKLLLDAPEYMYTSHYGPAAGIQWKNLGFAWPEKYDGDKAARMYIENVRKAALRKMAEKNDSDQPSKPVRSPMDIVKERTSDFIGEVEDVLDMFYKGVHLDIEEYSVYNEMVKADLNSFSAKHVMDYYIPLKEELEELVNDKTEDLVEGYSHMSVPQRKRYLKLVESIVSDAERYLLSKKAKRKPSKPKVKTADKQVAKVNYAKESADYKLTSINPALIVGASRVYTFHVKERIITEYVSQRAGGFEVRGSTIYGIDPERTRAIRLRKPEEQLSAFLTKTPAAINKFWDTLTTKTITDVNGRINKDTIILRALDK